MTAASVTFQGPIQNLRSARAGARPGDGTVHSLLDGEIFVNQADGIFQTLAANGQLLTFGTLAAAQAAAQAVAAQAIAPAALGAVMLTWLQSLPINPPQGTPGWWNNGGVPTYGAGA